MEIDEKLKKLVPEMQQALKEADVVNFSNKFIYVLDPSPIVAELGGNDFGFVYGSGPTACAGERIVSLVNGQLIFQGFKLTGGTITDFLREVAESALWAGLNGISGPMLNELVEQHFSRIRSVPRRRLVFNFVEERANKEEGLEGVKYHAGALKGRGIVREDEFLESGLEPDFEWYRQAFEKRFSNMLDIMRA